MQKSMQQCNRPVAEWQEWSCCADAGRSGAFIREFIGGDTCRGVCVLGAAQRAAAGICAVWHIGAHGGMALSCPGNPVFLGMSRLIHYAEKAGKN